MLDVSSFLADVTSKPLMALPLPCLGVLVMVLRHLHQRRAYHRQQETYLNIIKATGMMAAAHAITYAAHSATPTGGTKPQPSSSAMGLSGAWRETKSLLQDSSTLDWLLGLMGTLHWGKVKLPVTVILAAVIFVRSAAAHVVRWTAAVVKPLILLLGSLEEISASLSSACQHQSPPASSGGCPCSPNQAVPSQSRNGRTQAVLLSDLAVDQEGRLVLAH